MYENKIKTKTTSDIDGSPRINELKKDPHEKPIKINYSIQNGPNCKEKSKK